MTSPCVSVFILSARDRASSVDAGDLVSPSVLYPEQLGRCLALSEYSNTTGTGGQEWGGKREGARKKKGG